MARDFKPIAYLKDSCPFCFKLRVALLELGMLDAIEIRSFASGTQEETEIREHLSTKLERVMFPTVEISPGQYRTESDELIGYFAGMKGTDPQTLSTLKIYVEGPLKKLMALSKENRELKKTASGKA